MAVHNHGPYEGEGLDCNETRLSDGSLRGACMKLSFKDKFQLQFSKALQKYRADLETTGVGLDDAESHARFRALWAGSSEMGWCDLDDQGPKTYTGYYVWCTDHDMPATHCGTDGDTPVCVVHAQAAGCNCCPINYDEELRAEAKARFGSPSSVGLLEHHYKHQELVDGCLDCEVERAFEYAEIGERQVRDFLGRLDDLGIELQRKEKR